MSQKEHRQPPAFIHSALRDHNSLALPSVIRRASGIIIMGRRMKSLIFTTDIAIIRNCNADAVLAVYPFTPQQVIMDAIISASSIPVVCGVGGGVTDGIRSVMLAKDAEAQGAFGVVVNAPMRNQTVETMKKVVDIPIIATVTSENYDIAARLAAGFGPECFRCRAYRRGGAEDPGEVPRCAHHRYRRPHRRIHPADDRGRRQRHQLYAAFHQGAV